MSKLPIGKGKFVERKKLGRPSLSSEQKEINALKKEVEELKDFIQKSLDKNNK